MTDKNTLTRREEKFLMNYIKFRNIKESACLAGYKKSSAFYNGINILKKPVAKEFIRETEKALNDAKGNVPKAVIDRIITSKNNDAVYLAFQEDCLTYEQIADLDLDCIAEIKKPKGGGCEIKFIDRQKSAEILLSINNSIDSDKTAQSFFDALSSAGKTDSNETEDIS